MGHFEKSFYHVRDDTLILDLLKPKKGQVRAVLDTDTYNEIDHQFALVQMMLSKERIQVEAIYPAPYITIFFGRSFIIKISSEDFVRCTPRNSGLFGLPPVAKRICFAFMTF